MDMKSHNYYVDNISFKFWDKIQFEYYGSNSELPKEVSDLDQLKYKGEKF